MAESRFSDHESEENSGEYSDTKGDLKESNDESSKKIEISPSDIKEFFQVHLMYGVRGFVHSTYLRYTLDLIHPTQHSVDCHKSDKLFNDRKKNKHDKENHAEKKLLDVLESKIKDFESEYMFEEDFEGLNVKEDTQVRSRNDQKIKMTVNIVMNYSPCAECARKIYNFWTRHKTKDWESEISITFATFYGIYNVNDLENRHLEGLATLLRAGIKLQLVWDDDKLAKYIEEIGNKEAREARERTDRQYLQAVKEKAKPHQSHLYFTTCKEK